MAASPFMTPEDYFFLTVADGTKYPAHFTGKRTELSRAPTLYSEMYYDVDPQKPVHLMILCHGDLSKEQLSFVTIGKKRFKVKELHKLTTSYALVTIEKE